MTKLVFKPVFDDDETMKDGQVMRVPMMMMDAQQRAIAQELAARTPVFDTRPKASFDADENVRRTARQVAYDSRVSESWKQPPMHNAVAAPSPQAVYDKRISEAWRNAR